MCLLAVIHQMVNVFPFFAGKRYAFYNLYAIPEVLLSFTFLWLLVDHKKNFSRLLFLFVLAFLILFIFLFQKHDFTKRFFVECVAISNLMVVCGVLMIIYNTIKYEDFTIIKNQPESYFVLGLLFYAPLTVIIFTLWNFIHSHPDSEIQILNNIHSIANFIMYLLFALGIFMNRHLAKNQYLKARINR